MAGDWVKMRIDLPEDTDVIGMAESLGTTEYAVIGMLHSFWAWAGKNTVDGTLRNVSKKWIDRHIGVNGFSESLEKVNWLIDTGQSIIIPRWDRHNSRAAKERALDGERKRVRREQGR